MTHPFVESKLGVYQGYQLVSSGWAGVWAIENTRSDLGCLGAQGNLCDDGPRMIVRFLGGWDYTSIDCERNSGM